MILKKKTSAGLTVCKNTAMIFTVLILFSACSPDTSGITASPTESNPCETPYETPYEKDAVSEVISGVIVDNAPGVYPSPVTLTFETDGGTLYYKLDENDEYVIYTEPVVLNAFYGEKSDYPLTTAVDGVLDYAPGVWKSSDYQTNIQLGGNYYFLKKQPRIFLRYVSAGGETEETILSYIIDTDEISLSDMPVVSLSVDSTEFIGENGIYNNIFDDTKIYGQVEIIDTEYGNYYRYETSIKLGGNASLGYPQRTLNLNFSRNSLGEKNILSNANIFGAAAACDGSALNNISRFRLHNGGNVFESYTGFNDILLNAIFEGTNVTTVKYRYSNVYINGEYWGLYAIREKWSDTFIEDNYGIKKGNVLVYTYDDHNENPYTCDDGDAAIGDKLINEFVSYYTNTDLSIDENYKYFADNYLDIDSFIDYVIARSFAGDTDSIIRSSNNKLWRAVEIDEDNEYADGKWRFGLHDCDLSFTGNTSNLLLKTTEGSFCGYPLFDALMKNRTFRSAFYARAKELLETNLSYSSCEKIIDSISNQIAPYKRIQFLRWGKTVSDYESWQNNLSETKAIIKYRTETYLNGVEAALLAYGDFDR